MKKEDVLALLDGVEDLITPAVARRSAFFKSLKCPQCGADGGSVISEIEPSDLEHVSEVDVVPYGRGRCLACNCLFAPDTKIVIERGSITKAIEPAVAFINNKP